MSHRVGSARELLAGSLGSDPYQRIEELREAGVRKARAEGVAYQMEHERKIVLARIASELSEVHAKESLSEAKLDRLARADERYQTHIRGAAAAMEKRDLAVSEYFAIRSELLMDEQAIYHLRALARLEGTEVAGASREELGAAGGDSESEAERDSEADDGTADEPSATRAQTPARKGQMSVLRAAYRQVKQALPAEYRTKVQAVLDADAPSEQLVMGWVAYLERFARQEAGAA